MKPALDHKTAWEICWPRSMFEPERWSTIERLLYNHALSTDGCIMHAGVANGGSLGYFCLRYPERKNYGYCAFAKGAIGTSARDGALADGHCAMGSRAHVEEWLASIGVENAVLIDGDIRASLPVTHESVAMAIVDLNIYEPTLASLNWLKTHGLSGCLVIMDDWNWDGVKAAIDESRLAYTVHGYLATIVMP